ncbi:MAG: hypothetical protein ABL903_19815 [Methylococcales bacterium]
MSDFIREALVAVIDDAAKILQEAYVERGNRTVLEQISDSFRDDFETVAIKAAFLSLGLEMDDDGTINQASVTQAINTSLLEGTGVELTDIFDKKAIMNDLERIAIDRAISALGWGDEIGFTSLKPSSIKDALSVYVSKRIKQEVRDGTGVLIENAPEHAGVASMVAAYSSIENRVLVDTPEAENNRRRQATYRASHKRHWETRS